MVSSEKASQWETSTLVHCTELTGGSVQQREEKYFLLLLLGKIHKGRRQKVTNKSKLYWLSQGVMEWRRKLA